MTRVTKKDTDRKIYDLYLKYGRNVKKIATELGITHPRVREGLLSSGVPTPKRVKENIAEARDRVLPFSMDIYDSFEGGETIEDIAIRYDVSTDCIKSVLLIVNRSLPPRKVYVCRYCEAVIDQSGPPFDIGKKIPEQGYDFAIGYCYYCVTTLCRNLGIYTPIEFLTEYQKNIIREAIKLGEVNVSAKKRRTYHKEKIVLHQSQ